MAEASRLPSGRGKESSVILLYSRDEKEQAIKLADSLGLGYVSNPVKTVKHSVVGIWWLSQASEDRVQQLTENLNSQ